MNRFNVGDIVTLTKESLNDKSRWYYSQHYGDIGIIVTVSGDVGIEWRNSGYSSWYEQKHLKLIHKFNWSDYEKEQSTEKD